MRDFRTVSEKIFTFCIAEAGTITENENEFRFYLIENKRLSLTRCIFRSILGFQ
jgi:hypothetical protein